MRNITDAVLSHARDEDERILGRRLCDLAASVEKGSALRHTHFLTPSEQSFCMLAARHFSVESDFYGGYPGAERRVLVFYSNPPDLSDPGFPLAAVELSHSSPVATLTHRDFLGASLGLGIKRETVGDIIIGESKSVMVILRSVLPFILENFQKVGRTGLDVSEIPLVNIEPPEQKFELLRDTVASLRLDSIVASGFHLSRENAKQAIECGLVRLDHREELSAAKQVGENAVISLRGKGKIALSSAGGMSKKGRIWIEIKRYK